MGVFGGGDGGRVGMGENGVRGRGAGGEWMRERG